MRIKLSKSIMESRRHMSEEEIIAENHQVEAAKNDAEKFAVIYDKYFNEVFYFIFRRTDNEEVSADLTSQTFYNALAKIRSYKDMGLPFSAWLFKIASNEINKYYRKKKSVRIYSLEESKIKEIMAEAGEENIDEKIVTLIHYLNELPSELIEIMELRFFEGKNFKEIAFILGISESAAKMKVYRTLEKLRLKLKDRIRI